MDEIESQGSQPQPSVAELGEQLADLRHLVVSLLILALVVSGTLNLYLLRQVKFTRDDLQAFLPHATQMIAEFNKTSAPAMREFLLKLIDYGKTHPDFMPIAHKYGIKPGIAGASNGVPV